MSGLAVALAVSGAALGLLAGPGLDRMRWANSHPGAAVACWMSAIGGTVVSLSGLVMLVSMSPPGPGHGALEWLFRCLPHHAHPQMLAVALVAAVTATLCYAGLVRGVPRLWHAARRTRRHREMLGMVGQEDPRHADVLLIDHPAPVAYCLPVRRRPIVMSTGVLDRLDTRQIGAVLAHERVHLRQRHHLMLVLIDLAHAMFPWLPTMRMARRSVPPLLEMAADDGAVRRWGRSALTGALRQLTLLPGPAGSLSGADARMGNASDRIIRLDSVAAGARGVRAVALAASTVAITGPLGVAALAAARIPWPC